MGIFSILGFGKNKIKAALLQGAVVIDVRTANEYDRGRVPGSLNIPVDRIRVSIGRIRDLQKPVIVCCSSGDRSSKATAILKENGLKEVYNAGNWMSVMKMLE
ncbi:MAG: rhodanese-like domain-containing protein [Chitinophagaceae bacterium]|nr:rhodanese-like domain-containing protein [Chitinophagaceae bacterium]